MNQQAVLCVCHSLTVSSSCTEEEHDRMFLLIYIHSIIHTMLWMIHAVDKWSVVLKGDYINASNMHVSTLVY